MTYTTEEVIDLYNEYEKYLDISPKHRTFKFWLNNIRKTPAHNSIGNTSLGNQITAIENGNIVPR